MTFDPLQLAEGEIPTKQYISRQLRFVEYFILSYVMDIMHYDFVPVFLCENLDEDCAQAALDDYLEAIDLARQTAWNNYQHLIGEHEDLREEVDAVTSSATDDELLELLEKVRDLRDRMMDTRNWWATSTVNMANNYLEAMEDCCND